MELRGRDIKIPYLLTMIFIISTIFALAGSWTDIYHIIGLNSYLFAIPVLFILAFIISSLIVLLVSMWPKSIDIEFSQIDEDKNVKQKKIQEKEKTLEQREGLKQQKESLKPGIGKKESKFEDREAEFLESPAYQYLFDYVKRMIEENDIHIYWEKISLKDLLLNFNQSKSIDSNEAAGNNLKKSLDQLRLSLAKKRFYFSEKEFEALIERELFRQTYGDFKKYVLSRNPQKLDDYIFSFLKFVREYEYPHTDTREVIQKFIDRELDVAYLEEILIEQNFEYVDEDLYKEIRRVGEGLFF